MDKGLLKIVGFLLVLVVVNMVAGEKATYWVLILTLLSAILFNIDTIKEGLQI